MSTIAPVDSSNYSNINNSVFPVAPMDTLPTRVERVGAVAGQGETEREEKQNPDLSSYYKNIQPQDPLENPGATLGHDAREVDNVMVSAIANGYSVQAACNMKLAEWAYKADENVVKSTFEFEVV